jgi:hypothetical protein
MSRRGGKGRLSAFGFCVASIAALALGAPTASAAGPYYAAQGGSGTACTDIAPCTLDQALTSAGFGETILLKTTGGPFAVATDLDLEIGRTMRPAVAGQRPVLNLVMNVNMGVYGTLVGVEVTSPGPGTGRVIDIIGADALVDQAIVHATASTGLAVQVRDGGTLMDSVVWNESPTFGTTVAPGGTGGTVRNVTAIATGTNSEGFVSDQTFATGGVGPISSSVQNSIFRGVIADISATGTNAGAVTINVDHSNYVTTQVDAGQTINDLGGHQTSAPLFSNAAMGDFHQAAGSPTIDAGANVAGLGAFDLDGGSRAVNSTGTCTALPDIGADEFLLAVLPPASCNPTQLSPPPPPTTHRKKCKKKKHSAGAAKKKRCKKKKR